MRPIGFDVCAYSVGPHLLVRPATNDQDLRAPTFQLNHGGIDLRGYCCGVFVAGCQNWLDTFPGLLDEDARPKRAIRRYRFRAVHVIALDYASRTSGASNVLLPELGLPAQEIEVGNIDHLHWATIEKAWSQGWRGDVPRMASDPVLHGSTRYVVPKDVIERSLVIAHEIASRPGNDAEMLTNLYEAYSSLVHASYTNAFTMLWTVAERCLAIMYDRMANDPGRYRQNRIYISAAIKDLNAAGLLQPADHAFLDSVRDIRNDIAHHGGNADIETALELMWVTQRLLGASIDFRPTFGFSGQGLG